MSELVTKTVEGTKEKPASIEILEHPTFEGDLKTTFMSSTEMCDIVSSLFLPAFSDYHGCEIYVAGRGQSVPVIDNNPQLMGQLCVDLYFKDREKDFASSWKNLELIEGKKDTSKMSILDRYERINGITTSKTGRVYNVTKETYEALDKFMFNSGSNIRWNDYTQEIVQQSTVYGKEEIYVRISGLSLNKIITEIYGDKTKDGIYEYIAFATTIIPNQQSREFVLQVCQLDQEAVRRLQRILGVTNGALNFHRCN